MHRPAVRERPLMHAMRAKRSRQLRAEQETALQAREGTRREADETAFAALRQEQEEMQDAAMRLRRGPRQRRRRRAAPPTIARQRPMRRSRPRKGASPRRRSKRRPRRSSSFPTPPASTHWPSSAAGMRIASGNLPRASRTRPGQTDHRQTRLSGLPGGGWPAACHRGEATPGDRTTAAPSSAMRRSPIGVPEPRLHTIASATSRRGSAHPPEPPKPK
jgi:hypothetical protein